MGLAIATFGKFNIPHNGHRDLLRQMAQQARQAELIVGFSMGKDNRDVYKRLADYYDYNTSVADFSTCICHNLYAFIAMLSQEYTSVGLMLGTDRMAHTRQLLRYGGFTNIELIECERESFSPSSTKLRQLYKQCDGEFGEFWCETLRCNFAESSFDAILQYRAIQDEFTVLNKQR